MNTSTLIFLDEQAPMEPIEIKKHISNDTDVPTLLRILARTNIERSLKVLLELLEHKDQVRIALFAAKSTEYLDTEHLGAECLALVERANAEQAHNLAGLIADRRSGPADGGRRHEIDVAAFVAGDVSFPAGRPCAGRTADGFDQRADGWRSFCER